MGDKAEKVKAAEKKQEEPPGMLKEGQAIAAKSGCRYIVHNLLGKGGFGEVYKVSLLSDPTKKFAMKVEPTKVKKGQETNLRLKVELHVYLTIATAPDSSCDKSHFVKMHDKGKTPKFKYYVMDVIWMSLHEVVQKVLERKISPSTLIKIARQTLKGIEALHLLGFLHRDIKPANYAIGLPPNESTIYILDFGIARPFKDRKGSVIVPREKVTFMGTVRYASIRSMEKQEQCPKDDLEVWMYIMLELYAKDNLFWRGYDSRDDKFWENTLNAKRELTQKARARLFTSKLVAPEKYVEIIEVINRMKFTSSGDFTYINTLLSEIVLTDKIDENLPFDWIDKMPPIVEEPPKKVEAEKKVEPTKDESKKDQIDKPKDEAKKDRQNDKKRDRKSGSKNVTKGKKADDACKLTMEELKAELLRERKRKSKGRTTEDDYRRDDDEDSEESDNSESEEESRRRRRRKSRKRRSRDRDRDYSDREDDRDERDDRRHRRRSKSPERRMATKTYDETEEDRRRRRHRSPDEKKKRTSKKGTYQENNQEIPRIPEAKATVEDKEKDRNKPKEEKTLDVKEKNIDVDQKQKGVKTPEMDKDAKGKKDKKEGDAKKDQKSLAATPSPAKKADEAAPVKKEPVDNKKK